MYQITGDTGILNVPVTSVDLSQLVKSCLHALQHGVNLRYGEHRDVILTESTHVYTRILTTSIQYETTYLRLNIVRKVKDESEILEHNVH